MNNQTIINNKRTVVRALEMFVEFIYANDLTGEEDADYFNRAASLTVEAEALRKKVLSEQWLEDSEITMLETMLTCVLTQLNSDMIYSTQFLLDLRAILKF